MQQFGAHDQDSVRWAGRFQLPRHSWRAMPCLLQVGASPTRQQWQLNWCSATASKASHYKKRTRPLPISEVAPMNKATQCDPIWETQIR
jgi:hypothetical protein